MEKKLKEAYLNPKNPAAFSSVANLRRNVPGAKGVEEFLQGVETYTVHRPVRHRFPRRKTTGLGKFVTLQADLADYQAFKAENDDYAYLLVCVCCYSRMFFVRPLKTKTNKEVEAAFADIFKKDLEGQPPLFLVTDRGTEFTGKAIEDYFLRNGIHHYFPSSDTNKAAMVERANRTLKQRLERLMFFRSSRRYIDSLQDVVSGINRSKNRSIGMAPVDVTVLPLDKKEKKRPCRYKVGDLVRISMARGPFTKAYERGYSLEEFVISRAIPGSPPVYHLKDYNGEEIEGIFYTEELVPCKRKDDVYKVEKILRRRTWRGKKQVLVRWLGYGPAFDSWELEKDLVLL